MLYLNFIKNIHTTYIQLYLRKSTISILHCVILVSKWGVSKFKYIHTYIHTIMDIHNKQNTDRR